MSRTYDCRDSTEREDGVRTATSAIGRGSLVVMATDTVYGVAADAFNPAAVHKLLQAKGRGRSMPPPVLIAGAEVLQALTIDTPPQAQQLADAFWPGGLTLICWAQPSLSWDLGDTGGTVAVRVPDHPVALSVLRSTGPLAVSSANLTGRPVGKDAAAVREQLADSVEVYLESGELGSDLASTIIDTTGDTLRVVRPGAVPLWRLQEVVPEIEGPETEEPDDAPAPDRPSGGEGAPQAVASPDATAQTAPGTEPVVPSPTDSSGTDQPADGAGRRAGVYDARAAFAQARPEASRPRPTTYDARAAFAARGPARPADDEAAGGR